MSTSLILVNTLVVFSYVPYVWIHMPHRRGAHTPLHSTAAPPQTLAHAAAGGGGVQTAPYENVFISRHNGLTTLCTVAVSVRSSFPGALGKHYIPAQ